MKIVIFAGGRGSENLQRGINDVYGNFVDTTVIINAMDNGLSTGQCRQIYQGLLLGPSDLRKNQLLKHQLLNGSTELHQFLNIRFNSENTNVEEYMKNKVENIATITDETRQLFLDAINNFFTQPMSKVISYEDFSVSNLIYSGIAGMNGNSLSAAGKIMASHLSIPEDSVLIAADKPAFINAVTQTGKVLSDEVDIDEWDNAIDRITDLYFTDPHGKKITPPLINPDTHNAIVNADIIIFSAGTLWTSLIPTYMMTGIKDSLRLTKAKKYFVMNNENDLDTLGYAANEIQNLINRWLPMTSITTVFNTNASIIMREMERDETFPLFINRELSDIGEKSHHGIKLISAITSDYYSPWINNIHGLILDYDDTLVGRNNTFVAESRFNKELLNRVSIQFRSFVSIVTGNSIRSIDAIVDHLTVYADCGLNEYVSARKLSDNFMPSLRFVKKGSINEELMLTNEEVDMIKNVIAECGIDMSKVTNKANASIAIKPIIPEYREAINQLLNIKLEDAFNDYSTLSTIHSTLTGKTTIEINKESDKTYAVKKHINECDVDYNNICGVRPIKVVYVGDEGNNGNDRCIVELAKEDERLVFLPVSNPRDTLIYLSTLLGTTIRGTPLQSI